MKVFRHVSLWPVARDRLFRPSMMSVTPTEKKERNPASAKIGCLNVPAQNATAISTIPGRNHLSQ